MALNCLVFEKIAFLYFGDRQTNKQTNRWTGPIHEAALAVASGGLINISSFFHRRAATPFYIFHAKCYGNIPTGSITGASNACRWCRPIGKNRDSRPISGFIACVNGATAKCHIHTTAPDRGKLVTLIDGKRRRLLFAGDGRRSV